MDELEKQENFESISWLAEKLLSFYEKAHRYVAGNAYRKEISTCQI